LSTVGLKVAILGGGPAALTCGYYLNLAGCKVSLFNKEDQPGVFAGEEFIMNGDSVVEAAARGRKAAIDIVQFLNEQI